MISFIGIFAAQNIHIAGQLDKANPHMPVPLLRHRRLRLIS